MNFLGDEVFMNSSEDLKEYVLRQNGIVYQGSNSRPYPKRWYFGQVSIYPFLFTILKKLVFLSELVKIGCHFSFGKSKLTIVLYIIIIFSWCLEFSEHFRFVDYFFLVSDCLLFMRHFYTNNSFGQHKNNRNTNRILWLVEILGMPILCVVFILDRLKSSRLYFKEQFFKVSVNRIN